VAFRPRLATGLAFYWDTIPAWFVSVDNREKSESGGKKPDLNLGDMIMEKIMNR
jgi:hypothetical protein